MARVVLGACVERAFVRMALRSRIFSRNLVTRRVLWNSRGHACSRQARALARRQARPSRKAHPRAAPQRRVGLARRGCRSRPPPNASRAARVSGLPPRREVQPLRQRTSAVARAPAFGLPRSRGPPGREQTSGGAPSGAVAGGPFYAALSPPPPPPPLSPQCAAARLQPRGTHLLRHATRWRRHFAPALCFIRANSRSPCARTTGLPTG